VTLEVVLGLLPAALALIAAGVGLLTDLHQAAIYAALIPSLGYSRRDLE
jgi:hypothetical protein